MYSASGFTFSLILVSFCVMNFVHSINKYSKEANIQVSNNFNDDLKIRIGDSNKPFRMAKLNLLWAKAKLVSKRFPLEKHRRHRDCIIF